MRPLLKTCLVSTLVVLGLTAVAYPVRAQGLGDVARKEEERRKEVKNPGKVYTNKDLGSVFESSPGTLSAPGPAPAAADAKETPAKADEGKESGPKKDQAYWSGRKKDLQSKVETDQTLSEALQSRVNALTTDFVNRDDPIQRASIERDRQKALSELERVKKSITDGKKALTDLDEEARKAGVPPGWLR
jgi:hypothetical protein